VPFDPPFPRLVLGVADLCMYPPADVERRVEELVAVAASLGMTLIDTADAYCPDEAAFGMGESVVAHALSKLPDAGTRFTVMTKGGHTRHGRDWGLNGSEEYLLRACEASVRRLGRGPLQVYTLHRPDPQVPWHTTVRCLQRCVSDGLTTHVAISNVSAHQIRAAYEVLGPALTAVQNEFSLLNQEMDSELRLCEELGLTFFAWAPLGGARSIASLNGLPGLAVAARQHGCSPAEAALAWIIARSPVLVPIVGASRVETLRSCVKASGIRLKLEGQAAWSC
jgi:aryl-alcohol dehydrogenase-like predicted oxidoreductase